MASMQIESSFTAQLQETRNRIKSSFKRSHESLVVREMDLLTCVDKIEIDYKHNTSEIQESFSALDKIRSLTLDTLTLNTLSDTQQLIHSTISNKLTELTAVTYNTIVFDWSNQFDTDIEHIGTIKLNSSIYPNGHNIPITLPNYSEKQLPLIYCCKSSTEQKAPGVFCKPRGLGIHYKTGRIFIADRDNHRVQVFSWNGEYLSTLTDDVIRPRGICVYQDALFVTSEHRVSKYQLNGTLISRIGSEGVGELQFNIPFGLDVSEVNNNIYVCDYRNHRVQILTKDLNFHSMLGIGVFESPLAIKITKDKIFVLDESDPCLFVFTPDHILINRLITRGENKQTKSPADFAIDKGNNIIISDLDNHCVLVFNSEGEKTHDIGKKGQVIGEFVEPMGIALDNIGRIVVVCNKESACLQIF